MRLLVVEDDPDLNRQLVEALSDAGYAVDKAADGEEGPVHSVGMLLVRKEAWPIADLRVDWADEDPIAEITALWDRWKGEMEAYVSRALNPSVAPSYGVPGDL